MHPEASLEMPHSFWATAGRSTLDRTGRAGDRPIWMLNFLEFAEIAMVQELTDMMTRWVLKDPAIA